MLSHYHFNPDNTIVMRVTMVLGEEVNKFVPIFNEKQEGNILHCNSVIQQQGDNTVSFGPALC